MKYSEIRMLSQNPRYTKAIEIDILNLNYGKKYDVGEIIHTLLSYEGDWSDLFDLIEQLRLGYNPAMDQIFVLKGIDNFLYSIEGNRRLMCMNLISEFPKYEELLSDLAKDNMKKEVVKLLKEIHSENSVKFEKLKVAQIYDAKDEDEVWKIIYARHAGENKGKRNWSRLKYFYDLKDMFFRNKTKYDQKEVRKKLSYRFNKSLKSIDTDLINSLWVTDVVDTYNNNNHENEIKIHENNEKISALELSRSTIKVEYEDEMKTLNKLFDISVNLDKWKVEVKSDVSKDDLYIFLIKNLKAGNFTTRGWKDESIAILYGFVMNYLDSEFKGSFTFGQEIENAKNIPELNRTKLQKELIKYSNIRNVLKNTSKELIQKKSEFHGIKWGLTHMWINNVRPLTDILKIKSTNFPFLIASIIIRATLEMLSKYAILKSKSLRDKLLYIWENLEEEEKKKWNENNPLFANKLDFLKRDNQQISNRILKECKNDNVFEVIKKYIYEKKIGTCEILNIVYDDLKINKSEIKYKKIHLLIGYIDNQLVGKNNSIPNKIIHAYHYLFYDYNIDLAWESLNTQLEIISNIIRVWLLDDLTIEENII